MAMVDAETTNELETDIVLCQIRTSGQFEDGTTDQLMNGFDHGAPEIRSLRFGGSDVILECRMCRGLFRSLAHFTDHKRFCRQQPHVTTRPDTFCNRFTYNEVVVVEPRAPEDGVDNIRSAYRSQARSTSDRGRATLSQINNGTFRGRSQVYQWYTKLAEQIDLQKKINKTFCAVFTKIASNPNAVRVSYQEVKQIPPEKADVHLAQILADSSGANDCTDRNVIVQKDVLSIQKQTKPVRIRNGSKPQVKINGGKKTCLKSASPKTTRTPPKSVGSCSRKRSGSESSPAAKSNSPVATPFSLSSSSSPPCLQARQGIVERELPASSSSGGLGEGCIQKKTRKWSGESEVAPLRKKKRRRRPRTKAEDGVAEVISPPKQSAIQIHEEVKSNTDDATFPGKKLRAGFVN